MDEELYRLAVRVGRALRKSQLMVATAESCTGGWIGQAITMVPGSSEWFERGFITYTYISKREMLGVKGASLARYGAVSEQVVREMAQGALDRSHAQVSVAVSGVAGPSGGSRDKPVGTVCFAWARKGRRVRLETRRFRGDRDTVRKRCVAHALRGVLSILADRE
ncbi:MAG: CinA family protein [Betaproteobacteria bacterium]|nr:MAG: CinA family protein [Betaproteobacteria bacterium]